MIDLFTPAPACAACAHAVTTSTDARLTAWLAARGLGFCKPYSKRMKRKFLITLQNAGGALCGGRWFE